MPRHVTAPDQVEYVLDDVRLTVRPPSEPVPPALIGTRLGDIMAQLPRFADGDIHALARSISERVIARIESGDLLRHIDRALADLHGTDNTHQWMISVCPLSIWYALDIGTDTCVASVSALARGLGPGSTDRDLEVAIDATDGLWEDLKSALPEEPIRSAAIGLLFQGFDSVSALLGNGLIARATSAIPAASLVRRLLVETPPIRNTRRFDITGEPIHVDLEAATRASAGRPSYAFGFGPHRCPGQIVAFTIAIRALTQAPRLSYIPDPVAFLPYPNASVPDLRAVTLDWSTV